LYLLETDLSDCEAFKLPFSVKKGLYVEIFDNKVFTTPDTVLIDARGRYFAPGRVMRDIMGIDGTECDEIGIEALGERENGTLHR
jgi:hypothetical protein